MLPISPFSLACLLLGPASSLARTRGLRSDAQATFGPPSPSELVGEDDRWSPLARKYAPIIYLAEDERFFPSSTSFILPALTVLNATNDRYSPQPSALSQSNLDSLPYHGSDLHLAIVPTSDDPDRGRYNAQPDFPDEDEVDHRIYGQSPPRDGEGNWEVVALAVEKSGEGVVDLYYWTYYPFNFGKRVKGLGIVGNHISDWEAIMVRTINGEAVSVDYLAHTGNYGEGTVRWQDVSKKDGRPVAFSASGSHGLWSTPGKHVYASALGVFKLTDSTSYGARWDTSRQLLSHAYFSPSGPTSPHRRRRAVFSGASSWLNWRGSWGDTGEDSCWWFSLYPACQLVDGPQGPARDSMQEPPRCVISTRADTNVTNSRYTFSVSPHLLPKEKTTLVGVRQFCRRNGLDKVPDMNAEIDSVGEEDETSWTWQEIGSESSLTSENKFEMEIPQCRRRLHVVAYGIALAYGTNATSPSTSSLALSTSDKQTYVSPLRNICAYDASGESGKVRARAVVVEDVDQFGWQE